MSEDYAVTLRFFMDADTGAVHEVTILLPQSRDLHCDCVEFSEDEWCVHAHVTAMDFDEDGHYCLPMSEDSEANETVQTITGVEDLAALREHILRHSFIQVI